MEEWRRGGVEEWRSEEVRRGGMISVPLVLLASLALLEAAPSMEVHHSRSSSSPLVAAVAGTSTSLLCPLSSPLTVWLRGERVLFAGSLRVRQDPRITVEGNPSILTITGVQEEDAGVYRCQVEEEGGVLEVEEVEVVVHSPPTVTILGAGEVVTVREGTSMALRCRGEGTPTPMVSWVRGEGEVVGEALGEGGILLETITREDRGVLVCRGDNGVGEVVEEELVLEVLHPPRVTLLPPSLSPGGDCGLEVQCMVEASGEVEVQWRRGEHLLLPSTPSTTMWSLDSLHVLQVHSCHLGVVEEYSCTASTRLGTDTATVTVTEALVRQELARRAEEEEGSNTVRRNTREHALPLTSGGGRSALHSSSPLILLLVCARFM